jgi:uncharacterized iron-regulated protein
VSQANASAFGWRWQALAAIALALLGSACALIPDQNLRDTDHPLVGRLWDPAAAAFIDEDQLRQRAARAEVLLLGETHDNPEHHRLQRRMLLMSRNGAAPPALLMEQFDVDQQPAIDEAVKNGTDLKSLLRGWDWSQYRELLAAAKSAGMPLRAANLPRANLRPVVREGYGSLAAGEMARLGLDAAWDDAREKFMLKAIEGSHCGKITPQLRVGLVRAQRLRDATLADTALANIDHGVVFILGRVHARYDVGVPLYLEARRPGTRVLSIGLVEVSSGRTEPTQYETERAGSAAPHDLIWFTPRVERPDPCLAFGK